MNMQNLFWTWHATMALCLLISGCENDTDLAIEELNLNATSLNLNVGDEHLLQVTTTPSGTGEDLALEWRSSDPNVASVDNGLVKANEIGEADIIVSYKDLQAICNVIVDNGDIKVTSVTVNPNSLELEPGETASLTATIEPEDSNCKVQWKSSNHDVASVDENGVVTGIAPGNAIIMAEAGGVTGDCMVSVVGVPVESVTLDVNELEMEEKETRRLTATVLPENADNKALVWTSSDETIATVSGSGVITAISPGKTEITVQAGNVTDKCVVTVSALPLGVGHFYYSDGSWSASLDQSRTVIGIVFYVGDITQSDPALAREHPECTHGLVVSIDESDTGIAWQANNKAYNNTIGSWIESNLDDYISITTGYELEDNLNVALGYNNTKAIEAFNEDPTNSEWPVDIVRYITEYREKVPAPKGTSDWYLGSAKEMNMLAAGEYNGNIWDIRDAGISVDNLKLVNKSIQQVSGGKEIDRMMTTYWTSTETSAQYAIVLYGMNGQMPETDKSYNNSMFNVRPILAF